MLPSQEARKRARAIAPAETRILDDHLYVTMNLPHIEDAEMRYAIRSRYLLVWGDRSPHADQYFVLLPKRVDPEHNTVRFQNGVLDVKVRLRSAA